MSEFIKCEKCDGKGIVKLWNSGSIGYCFWCAGTGELNWIDRIFGKKWDSGSGHDTQQDRLRCINREKFISIKRIRQMEEKCLY